MSNKVKKRYSFTGFGWQSVSYKKDFVVEVETTKEKHKLISSGDKDAVEDVFDGLAEWEHPENYETVLSLLLCNENFHKDHDCDYEFEEKELREPDVDELETHISLQL